MELKWRTPNEHIKSRHVGDALVKFRHCPHYFPTIRRACKIILEGLTIALVEKAE
ncbi:hypothetical protein GA0070215_1383 [Micromonospora marina]|uniref:Uncharacterized protein n=1 Tax=Micromonospora marina TaxID=307120 RepID=A0A1C5AKT0_9ACTN|nr:hypothetical protein GA0070215_1383 [Micromonospora marina]